MSFSYNMLIVDDRQDLGKRSGSIKGVKITQCKSVDEVLAKLYQVQDALQASVTTFHKHKFDFVVLDFDLEPGELADHQLQVGKHPLGGLTLYPIFANSFAGPGNCVVVNYSDKLGKLPRLQTLRKLTEIGHSLQHGKDLTIAQTGFMDVNLVPLVKQRCHSILRCCGRSVFHEVQSAATKSAGVLSDLLDEHEIPSISSLFGNNMTLGDLRPDIGRPNFVRESDPCRDERMITHHEEEDFRLWFQEMRQYASMCFILKEAWNARNIHPVSHSPAVECEARFWKDLIIERSGVFTLRIMPAGSTEWRELPIPRAVAEGLSSMHWKNGVGRCDAFHRFFRLSLLDAEEQRNGDGAGYAKGYFLNDLSRAIGIHITQEYRNETARNRYLYIPMQILAELVKNLISEVGCSAKEGDCLIAAITTDGGFAEFRVKANPGRHVQTEDVDEIMRTKTWRVFPEIDEWGDFLLIDETRRGWASSPIGKVSVPLASSDVKPNTFVLRFPILD